VNLIREIALRAFVATSFVVASLALFGAGLDLPRVLLAAAAAAILAAVVPGRVALLACSAATAASAAVLAIAWYPWYTALGLAIVAALIAAAAAFRSTRRARAVFAIAAGATAGVALAYFSTSVGLARGLHSAEAQAWNARAVDWPRRRGLVRSAAMVPGATEVRLAVQLRALARDLGDGHSQYLDGAFVQSLLEGSKEGYGFFAFPRGGPTSNEEQVGIVVRGSSAAGADIRPGDSLLIIGDDRRTLTGRNERTGRRFEIRARPFETYVAPRVLVIGGILYLDLPLLYAFDHAQRYVDDTRRALAALPKRTCGTIVDMRTAYGGPVGPLLEVIAAAIPRGHFVVRYVERDGRTDEYHIDDGAMRVEHATLTTRVSLRDGGPVAVLTGPMTASAGEAVALALTGTPLRRTFGLPTSGQSSGTIPIALPVRGYLLVAIAASVDAAGELHTGPLPVDVEVSGVAWNDRGSAADPGVRAAVKWIRTRCATKPTSPAAGRRGTRTS
jgi:hypothetical protein